MRENNRAKLYILPLILVPLLILLDRLTKIRAARTLKDQADIILWRGVLRLRYLENEGAAFGILRNARVLFLIFTVLMVAGGIALYVHYVRKGSVNTLTAVLFSMLLAGAAGNFWDRAVSGTVIDFIYVELIDFPIFNLADIYITCSCIAAVILVLWSARHDKSDI